MHTVSIVTEIYQSRLKTLEKRPFKIAKISLNYAKVAKFCQIWSRCSQHTQTAPDFSLFCLFFFSLLARVIVNLSLRNKGPGEIRFYKSQLEKVQNGKG